MVSPVDNAYKTPNKRKLTANPISRYLPTHCITYPSYIPVQIPGKVGSIISLENTAEVIRPPILVSARFLNVIFSLIFYSWLVLAVTRLYSVNYLTAASLPNLRESI